MIAVPGLTPKSPVTTVGPVLVTAEPASTEKLAAVPRLGAVANVELFGAASGTGELFGRYSYADKAGTASGTMSRAAGIAIQDLIFGNLDMNSFLSMVERFCRVRNSRGQVCTAVSEVSDDEIH